jgi:hypothetical protein
METVYASTQQTVRRGRAHPSGKPCRRAHSRSVRKRGLRERGAQNN